jgi:hypothetical protein
MLPNGVHKDTPSLVGTGEVVRAPFHRCADLVGARTQLIRDVFAHPHIVLQPVLIRRNQRGADHLERSVCPLMFRIAQTVLHA